MTKPIRIYQLTNDLGFTGRKNWFNCRFYDSEEQKDRRHYHSFSAPNLEGLAKKIFEAGFPLGFSTESIIETIDKRTIAEDTVLAPATMESIYVFYQHYKALSAPFIEEFEARKLVAAPEI